MISTNVLVTVVHAAQLNVVYDATSNLVTGEGLFREYNSFNQLVRVWRGNASAYGRLLEEYIYHPVEERVLVKKIYDSYGIVNQTYIYVNDQFVRLYDSGTGSWYNDTYYAKDSTGLVGEVVFGTSYPNTTFVQKRKVCYFTDHEQSVSVAVGSTTEYTFYEPFGKIRPTNDAIKRI